MNKILYIILIFFLGLSTASEIWDFILTNQIGGEIYKADFYITWFLFVNLSGITGSILLLKYFHHHNYRVAFLAGTIFVTANLGNAIVSYIVYTSGLRDYYKYILLFYFCAVILYALALIFSTTRNRYWLKLAGICMLVIVLISAAAFIESIYSKDVRTTSISGKIVQWGIIVWDLVNVMFILNLVGEIRMLGSENVNLPRKKYSATILGFFAMVAVAFMVAIGTLLVRESNAGNSQQLVWRNDNAQWVQQLVDLAGEARTFVNSEGDSLHYLLIKPQKKYNPEKKYPLVVCLPYLGYETLAAKTLSTGTDRYTSPAYIFVPYCPAGLGWGGIFGTPSLESLVYETISTLDEPGIDIKRRYLTGVSRGGYGTWQFICTRPDLFAAAIPVCGGGDPNLASKIANMPVWAFHGAKDKNVPVSGSRDMISAIKKREGIQNIRSSPMKRTTFGTRLLKHLVYGNGFSLKKKSSFLLANCKYKRNGPSNELLYIRRCNNVSRDLSGATNIEVK